MDLGFLGWLLAAFGASEIGKAFERERQPHKAGVAVAASWLLLAVGLTRLIIYLML